MYIDADTKSEYLCDSAHKTLTITFPDLNLTLDRSLVYSESMVLQESIMEGEDVAFVGCISSLFEIQIYGVYSNLKGELMEASIKTDNSEAIPLFHGYVDSVSQQTNKNYKKITAYDVLYTKGNTDVAAWYNSLTFPVPLKEVRDSLFEYLGITQEEKSLPNDSIIIDKQYAPTSLKALNVIKAICQINGACGIINREGNFEYRILPEITGTDGAYPGLTFVEVR